MILLTSYIPFAVVGQRHPGWIGFLQDHVLSCLGCIFFERKEAKDRKMVSDRLHSQVNSDLNAVNPLLIFPEGTCVARYCVMFKKGAFELGATVVPIALKYDYSYSDCHWNSREQSFAMHLFALMCSWATVCDIYVLEPVDKGPTESVLAFTERVKQSICRKAKLESVAWDGALKYLRLSSKYTNSQQEKAAAWIRSRLPK